MSITPEQRRQWGSLGGLTSWVNTEDRRARIYNAKTNSPLGWAWHARQLGLDPENLTDEEVKRVETARKLWFKRISIKGNNALKRKRAAALRERAAALEAEARDGA